MGYYDPARLEAMRQMYEAGHSLEEVGAAFYTCPENVHALFKKYNIPRRPRSLKTRGCYNPERLQQMRQLYAEGMSQSEIARAFDLQPSTISHLFKSHGVKTGSSNS